jgi:ribonuclease M5
MLKIREAIAVEGKYDKNTLSQLVDTVIIQTDGFSIFKNQEQTELLRRLARQRGLIILTDSDGAGFLIRNHLKGCIDPNQVKHAYIPDVMGKERRKRSPGKEGKLGVEGMSPAVLEEALRRAGATFEDTAPSENASEPITKADLFALGLSGRPDSASRRAALIKRLNLPSHLSPNALLQVLNALYSFEEVEAMMEELE